MGRGAGGGAVVVSDQEAVTGAFWSDGNSLHLDGEGGFVFS